MKNLDRWIAAYVAMDQRRREENLDLAESDALDHPAAASRKLRLLANSGNVIHLRDAVGRLHDFGTAIIVSSVKKRQ